MDYKKIIFMIFILIFAVAIFAGCRNKNKNEPTDATQVNISTYYSITQEEAKRIMDNEENYIILDVREQSEYDEGHIKNAILLPYTEIETRAEKELPDKEQIILIYCRSGRRSKIAAQSLANAGYKNVKEFGGIIDWQYEIER